MRRLVGWIFVLALLILAAGALGESAGTPDLCELYIDNGSGSTWACTAVPVFDGFAFASGTALPDEIRQADLWDGTAFHPVSAIFPVADGELNMVLYEADGKSPAIPSYSLTEAGKTPGAGDMLVRSGDWMFSRINRAVYSAEPITLRGYGHLLLTLSGDTVAGAPLLTADGKLAGIVTGEYAEGKNRYTALTADSIADILEEAIMLLSMGDEDTRPEGFEVRAEGNIVTFGWANMQMPEKREGEELYLVIADLHSTYLSYIPISDGMTETVMLLTPGRTYWCGIGAFAESPDIVPAAHAAFTLPEAEPLTEYAFRSEVFTIAEKAKNSPSNQMPVPVTEVTESFLRSGRACILSSSTYETDGTRKERSLLITLTAPDGNNYRYESGWYYEPSLAGKDEWYVSLEESGLLSMMEVTGYPEGTYQVDMYIGGQLADSFSFTLIK